MNLASELDIRDTLNLHWQLGKILVYRKDRSFHEIWHISDFINLSTNLELTIKLVNFHGFWWLPYQTLLCQMCPILFQLLTGQTKENIINQHMWKFCTKLIAIGIAHSLVCMYYGHCVMLMVSFAPYTIRMRQCGKPNTHLLEVNKCK